ncbi:MAG: hypothetical protein QQN53_03690 [Nitrosopumilus sp.]
MTKHTIGVYQAYKNSGNLRFHKSNTKKHWKHFFIEVDDYDVDEKHKRITEIGHELYADGGVDALENFFFVLKNRIIQEIEKDPSPMRSLWNGLTNEWQY